MSNNERMLTSSKHSWVGVEFSTEVEKMKWIDVPTHIGEFLTHVGIYFRPASLANKMAEHNMSVSDIDACLKWFVDHSGHCFTFYYQNKHPFGRRWRMSKKQFTHKSYNYYVLTALPKAKMDKLSAEDNNKVAEMNDNKHDLESYNTKLTERLAGLDIHALLRKTIESHFEEMLYMQWDTHPLAKADDFVATLKSDYLIDTQGMSFDEQIEKVKVGNTQVKQFGASVFTNILAIETAKERALAGIAGLAVPTQESEEE